MEIGEHGIRVKIYWEVEIIMFLLFLLIAVFLCRGIIKNEDEMSKKLFFNGLKLKILSSIMLPLVYMFYYKGGDTISYFHDGDIMRSLFWDEPSLFFDFIFNGMEEDGIIKLYKQYFRVRQLGLDYFVFKGDERAMFVVRIAGLLLVAAGGSIFAAGFIVSLFCYLALWKVYKLFILYYPIFKRQLSYTVLYIPSVVFWGSGILKDPITLGALCLLVFYFHAVMKKENLIRAVIWCIVSSFLIISIKPYIFNAFLIGMGCWVLSNYLVKIKSVVFRALIFPILLALAGGLVVLSLNTFSDNTGQYSVDKVMDEAVVVQNDLKQDYYGGHRFDIGSFEPTVAGIAVKAPIAIATTLFRPFVWEADNPFILMSALESLVVLVFTLMALFRIKLLNLQGVLLKNPLLFFSFVFSLFFAFSVGLTTANFGALVRYKIPLMPFYLSMVYILSNYKKIPVEKKEEIVSPTFVS